MFLSARTIRGRKYLYLLKSVFDEKKKCYVNKIAINYGRYENIPEDIRLAFEDKQKRKALEKELSQRLRAGEAQAAQKAVEKMTAPASPNFNRAYALRYGHLPLKTLWDKELELKYKIDYLQRSATSIQTWKLNDLIFYLCALKIIEPVSFFGAVRSKSDFFYCPWKNIAQDNF